MNLHTKTQGVLEVLWIVGILGAFWWSWHDRYDMAAMDLGWSCLLLLLSMRNEANRRYAQPRVPPGRCPSDAPQVLSCSGMPLVRCELRAGHAGDHEAGSTRWWSGERVHDPSRSGGQEH